MDWTLYLRTLLALIFVLGLIGAVSWAGRRFGFGHGASLRRGRRLTVVESLGLDSRRRLVLVRRDDTEHLLLLGINADLVVESRIVPTVQAVVEEQQP